MYLLCEFDTAACVNLRSARISLQGVLHSSLTARVILNLRQAGKDSMHYIERTSGNEPIELTSICYPRTYD